MSDQYVTLSSVSRILNIWTPFHPKSLITSLETSPQRVTIVGLLICLQLLTSVVLGPLTPSQILLSRSPNDLLTTHITKLNSVSRYLVPVWTKLGPKLDHFCILNFPSLFSDWSIQKFLKSISQKIWIDQSEKREEKIQKKF